MSRRTPDLLPEDVRAAVASLGLAIGGAAAGGRKGRQVPIATETIGETAVIQRLKWTAPDGAVVLEKVRRIDVAAGGATSPAVLTWRSVLALRCDVAVWDGDPGWPAVAGAWARWASASTGGAPSGP